jgi:hypothetical protein
MQDALTGALHGALVEFKGKVEAADPVALMGQLVWKRQEQMKQAREAGHLEKEQRDLWQREINVLEQYRLNLQKEEVPAAEAMDAVRGWFGEEVDKRTALAEETGMFFDNAFRFLENALSQGQELVLFVTEVTAGYDTSWFVENFGCDAYFRHNRELLFDTTRSRIQREIAAARSVEREEN